MTLIELLVAISLLGLFGAAMTAVIRNASWVAVRATDALVRERALLATEAFLRHELGDAAWSEVQLSSDTIALPRRVGQAIVCGVLGRDLLVDRASWDGDRTPNPTRDEVRTLEGSSGSWQRRQLTALSSAFCPGGEPAWIFTLSAIVDSPRVVRVFEPVLLRRYRSGAHEWLGLVGVLGGGVVQPFAGPLRLGGPPFGRDVSALIVPLEFSRAGYLLRVPLASTP